MHVSQGKGRVKARLQVQQGKGGMGLNCGSVVGIVQLYHKVQTGKSTTGRAYRRGTSRQAC